MGKRAIIVGREKRAMIVERESCKNGRSVQKIQSRTKGERV